MKKHPGRSTLRISMQQPLPKLISGLWAVILLFLVPSDLLGQNFRSSDTQGEGSGILTLTINKPAGTVQGDVMIAAIAVTPSGAPITAPAGWTQIRRTVQGSATSNVQETYYKVAGASEPSDYSWTLSTSNGSAGGISTFYNVSTSSPIHRNSGTSTNSALTHSTPSITTTVTNTMIVATHSFSSSATWTPPTGMTESVDVASTNAGNAGVSLEMSYNQQATTGATGAQTATASGNADRGVAQIIALRGQCNHNATISYASPPYCSSGGIASITHSGTTGGTYSSTSGLSIDANTGDIDLAASTPGTYTVTYSIPASGACALVTSNTSVTVVANPSPPIVTSPVIYCQNATATQLTATGTLLTWGSSGGAISGAVGGTSVLSTQTYVDATWNNKTTYFTTSYPGVAINSVDYFIPSWQAVNGLVLGLFDGSGTLLATSSTSTSMSANSSPVQISNVFNYTLSAAGNYQIGVAAGTGNIGYDSPSFPITEPTGAIVLTGTSVAGNRCFNNIQFTYDPALIAPTPSTAVVGTTNYYVTQTVSGCTSTSATIAVEVKALPGASGSATDRKRGPASVHLWFGCRVLSGFQSLYWVIRGYIHRQCQG